MKNFHTYTDNAHYSKQKTTKKELKFLFFFCYIDFSRGSIRNSSSIFQWHNQRGKELLGNWPKNVFFSGGTQRQIIRSDVR